MNFGRVAFREIRFLRVGGETGLDFNSLSRLYFSLRHRSSFHWSHWRERAFLRAWFRYNKRRRIKEFFPEWWRKKKKEEEEEKKETRQGRTKGENRGDHETKNRTVHDLKRAGLIQFPIPGPFLITFMRLSWSQQLLSNQSREEIFFFFFYIYRRLFLSDLIRRKEDRRKVIFFDLEKVWCKARKLCVKMILQKVH